MAIKRIYLTDIRDELMTFAPDPDPNDAFNCAFEWWKDNSVHKGWRTHQFFYLAFTRGWLCATDAEAFCNFLNPNHFWHCLR